MKNVNDFSDHAFCLLAIGLKIGVNFLNKNFRWTVEMYWARNGMQCVLSFL